MRNDDSVDHVEAAAAGPAVLQSDGRRQPPGGNRRRSSSSGQTTSQTLRPVRSRRQAFPRDTPLVQGAAAQLGNPV